MKAKISLLTAFVAALCAASIIFCAGAAALPKKVDPDRDGMPTRWEKRYHLNPEVKDGARDYDHDGLTNKQEYEHHTNPRKADTDGDGMPDGWEVIHHLNPLKKDATQDRDHDGASNGQEYKAGTNPDSAKSVPDDEGEEPTTPSFKNGYAIGCQRGTKDAQETIATGVDHYTEEEVDTSDEEWNEGWESGYGDCYGETLEANGFEWGEEEFEE